MTEVKVAAVPKKYMLRSTRNKFINSLSEKLQMTEALILDAETQGRSSDLMNNWLKDARDVCEDAESLLDDFDYRSSTSSGFIDRLLTDVKFRYRSQKVHEKLKKICEGVLDIDAQHAGRETSSFLGCGEVLDIDAQHTGRETSSFLGSGEVLDIDAQNIGRETSSFSGSGELYGRDEEIATLKNMLLYQRNVNYGGEEQDRFNVDVISIVGMGGIGKTVLAKQIFNDQKISDHFEAKGWVCVTKNPSNSKVVKDIISSLTGKNTNVDDGLDTLHLHLRNVVAGKRFLLVLDDVWTEDPWWELLRDCFVYAAKGSRILVTTRMEGVARMTGSTERYHLEALSTEACWHLFSESISRS